MGAMRIASCCISGSLSVVRIKSKVESRASGLRDILLIWTTNSKSFMIYVDGLVFLETVHEFG